METKRFTGVSAGSQKYDLLTAIAVAGLNGSTSLQTSMLRLVALITARYNWARDELTVGQREMARMWSVDLRTVKREIKRLTDQKILLQLRPGVRGRVAAYRLNVDEIHRLSAPVWDKVGPDFSDRMAQRKITPVSEKVVRLEFGQQSEPAGQADPWTKVRKNLALLEPDIFKNWYAQLSCQGLGDGVLTLTAPTAFVAQYVQTHHLRLLQGAVQMEFSGVRRIEIASDAG